MFQAMKRIAASVPLRRTGTKDDVANLCLFLASPMASYISGTVIPVDGAWSLAFAGTEFDAFASQPEREVSNG